MLEEEDEKKEISSEEEEKKEEEEMEEIKLEDEKEEDITEQEKYKRMKISNLLSTDSERDLAENVFQLYGKKKYSIDVILCLIRHCESKENQIINSLLSTLNDGFHFSI